jgi:transposase
MVSTMKIVDTKKISSKSGSTPGVRVNRTGRRTYSPEYQRGVVEECDEPGVSVAGVALAHGINANLLRRWIVRQRRESAKTIEPSRTVLLPVSVQRASPAPEAFGNGGMSTATTKPRRVGAATIEIEVYGTRVHLRGGVDAETLRAVLDVLSQR